MATEHYYSCQNKEKEAADMEVVKWRRRHEYDETEHVFF
jgi:hypothetical protein